MECTYSYIHSLLDKGKYLNKHKLPITKIHIYIFYPLFQIEFQQGIIFWKSDRKIISLELSISDPSHVHLPSSETNHLQWSSVRSRHGWWFLFCETSEDVVGTSECLQCNSLSHCHPWWSLLNYSWFILFPLPNPVSVIGQFHNL